MATNYKLYDIGSVTKGDYLYKGVYRINKALASIDRYELIVTRYLLATGEIDRNYGQNAQGAFRALVQLNPTYPVDYDRLCPGITFDENDFLTFSGITYMSSIGNHGFYICKLNNTGNLEQSYGTTGFTVAGFSYNVYSCTKELLIDESNKCIFGISTRQSTNDISSPSYISRRLSNGNPDPDFGINGKVEILHDGIFPQVSSLTFDNYGNYYVGYNSLQQDGSIFGNSYIKSYNYAGNENDYFSKNDGSVIVDAGLTFAGEAPQDYQNVIVDHYLDNVTAFLNMDNVYGPTTLVDNVSNKEIKFNGNAEMSTVKRKFGSSSLHLDGAGQSYMEIGGNAATSTAASPADFQLGSSGDFCIEGWFYFESLGNGNTLYSLGGSNPENGLLMQIKNDNSNVETLNISIGNSSSNSVIVNMTASDYSLKLETWAHIALVRKDFNYWLFIDGDLMGAAYSNDIFELTNAGGLKIGANQSGDNVMLGYVDDFRITQGHSRYVDRFEPSKHANSNVGALSDVKLLLHFEGEPNSKSLITRGQVGTEYTSEAFCRNNAIISNEKHKFGETSLKLDGASYAEINDSPFIWTNAFYEQNFTIEGWIYINDVPYAEDTITFFSKMAENDAGESSFRLGYEYGQEINKNPMFINVSDGTQLIKLNIEETVLEKGKWYHLALVKTGLLGSDEWKLYINGNGKLKTSSLPTNASSHNWIIGANNSNTKANPVYNSFLNGYIDEFRIVSNKVYNSNFAPKNHQFFPTQESALTTNDQYSGLNKLLMHFEELTSDNKLIDSSATNAAISMQNGTLTSNHSRYGRKSLSVPAVGIGANIGGLVSNATDIGSGNIDYTIEMYFKMKNIRVGFFTQSLFKTSDNNMQHLNITIGQVGPDVQMKVHMKQDIHEHTIQPSVPVVANKWVHLALVRRNQIVKLYIDGIEYGNMSEQVNTTINGPFILGNDLDGYIDELRITDGLARYTDNFTPQTHAFGSQPYSMPEPAYEAVSYANTQLLLRFDDKGLSSTSSPLDSSSHNRTVSVFREVRASGPEGEAISSNDTSGRNRNIHKFGKQSWKFNGNSKDWKHLELNSLDFNWGSDEFCVELWYYPTEMVGPKWQKLICNSHTNPATYSSDGFLLGISNENKLFCKTCGINDPNVIPGNVDINSLLGPDMTPYMNRWNHIAVTRDNSGNGTLRLFLNGDIVASHDMAGAAGPVINNSPLRIGGYGNIENPDDFTRGYLDDVHIRTGTSVYTNNFAPASYSYGKKPTNAVVEPTNYFESMSEIKYMLPLTQTSSFLSLTHKKNNDGTSFAEILNIKHSGKYAIMWGSSGKASLTSPEYDYIEPHTMWMDRELNLYVGGQAKKSSTGVTQGIVWKLDSNGDLDTSFGVNGIDIKNNSTNDEAITSIINNYLTNEMVYTAIYLGDSTTGFENIPFMGFGGYTFGGDVNFLTSYKYIDKTLTPDSALNRVLQDMELLNAAHIKMPASMFNGLFKSSWNEGTQSFATDSIVVEVDQAANDNISVVSGGLIKDFWNYFVSKVESHIPNDKRHLWDESASGANGYTDAKLQTFFRDKGLGQLNISKINDIMSEYQTNSLSLFSHRVIDASQGTVVHKREGFQAGDKAGINAGVTMTFNATISAATGGTAQDTVISETRTFNLILELE